MPRGQKNGRPVASGNGQARKSKMNNTTINAAPATGLVPVFTPQREPINEDRAAMEIALLRRRQLRRADVQAKLREYAERREARR